MSKEIFYYSVKCMFCKEAYMLISKIGKGKENVLFVDVENEQTLPSEVDRVPCLQTKESGFLFEDSLFEYLKMKLDIAPFMVNEMGSKFSDKYSYMDESGTNLDHNYLFLDKEFRILTPSTEADNARIIDYEKFIAQRDNDLKVITK